MECSVCGRGSGAVKLIKCANPRCRHYICQQHALRYEISDERGMRFEDYCSRACYIEHVRKSLPVREEILIAGVVIITAIGLYLAVVRLFL